MEEQTRFSQLGNDTIRFVLVKTTWPGTDRPPHFQLTAALRERSLEEVQQVIQDDFDQHAAEEHPGTVMAVEVFDADAVPEGTMPPGTEATSTQEIVDLARAIAQERGE